MTISIGGAYGRDQPLAIMKSADKELYKAKKTKNTVKIMHHVKG